MTRTQKWLSGLAAFAVVAGVALYFFDWNLAKPYVARKVTAATGRAFAINGNLDVRLSFTPRISAEQVVLGNAPWSSDPNMVEVKRLEFSIELLPLLSGHVRLPDIALSGPRVVLERNAEGTPNWEFNKPSRGIPDIGAFAIDRGTLVFRDPKLKSDLTLDVETRNDTSTKTIELNGKGTFKGLPTTIHALGGELLSLRDTTKPYPIDARAQLGGTRATAKGTLADPLHLTGENIDFTLEGNDLAQLYPIVGVPIPPTPPYKLKGSLNHTGHVWTLKQLKGVVGSSDLNGDFSVDRGRSPQMITANLVSNRLDMADLGGFIGADRGKKPAATHPPANRVLPTEPFNLEKLRSADADVHFRGAKIVTEKLPLENMDVHMKVDGGRLELSPLSFSVAGGLLESQIRMDGRSAPISTQAEIAAKGLHLEQLMPVGSMKKVTSGTIGGRAKLAMSGNSVAQMLGSANGEAALIMDGGSISELAVRLSNLDVANSLVRLIGGDRQTPIRCMVSNWNATNGVFEVQSMVLDTPKVNLYGTGTVNMKTEALDLRLTARSKTFSLAALRGPIDIGGTFKNPSLRPDLRMAITRGGLAVAIGSVTAGVGALLPLLEFGRNQESACVELKTEAKKDVGVRQSDLADRKKKRAG